MSNATMSVSLFAFGGADFPTKLGLAKSVRSKV